jgi:hypothetical protein
MKYWVDGCTGRKCQEKGRLAIIHVRGATFCFLMSLLFFVIFVVCRLWNLVCCFSWNADAQIRSWWWVIAFWILVFGVM